MGESESSYKQSTISSLLIYGCTAAVIGFGYLYETRPTRVSAPQKSTSIVKTKPSNFFTPTFFQSVKDVEITGAQGNFQLEKNLNNSWSFKGTGRYPAHNNKVFELLTSFANLKIDSSYAFNISNATTFGFLKPSIELKLKTLKETKEITIGRIDFVNKSAYIKSKNSSLIHKVYFENFPFHHLSAHNFLQEQIFNLDIDKLERVEITKTYKGRNKVALRKGDQRWLSSRNKSISNNKVQQLVSKIQSIKIEAILNHNHMDLLNTNQFIGRTLYKINIQSNGHPVKLKLQKIKKDIPTLTMKTKNTYLLTSNDGANPMIINKDQLKFFNIKESQLTNLRVSDLIY